MIQREIEASQTLVDLGLSLLQARIYLCIVRNGCFGIEVGKISKISKIARQDIYRTLPQLEAKGLVEKIISSPTKYKPIPFEDGLRLLMKKYSEKHQQIQNRAKSVLEKAVVPSAEFVEEESSFVIGSEIALLMKRLKERINNTSDTIDLIYYQPLKIILFHTTEEFRQALKRGVKVRVISRKETYETFDDNLKTLIQQNVNFRCLKEEIPVGLSIFDGKEVFLRTGKSIVPSLWTNNENFVKLAMVYYETMWEHALKMPLSITAHA
ncbi:MAG: TrmB family transcriptional regulator [Candidatus Bathyarchaeia archaeon]|jgi:sugar-specific transcriptional regulator TrmB